MPKEDQILSTRERGKIYKKPKRSTSRYGYVEAFSRLFMALFSGLFGSPSFPHFATFGTSVFAVLLFEGPG